MAKPLRPRLGEKDQTEVLVAIASLRIPMPTSSAVTQRVIISMLKRLKRIDPGHEKHVSDVLRALALYERCQTEDESLREKIYQQAFAQISDPRLPRGHWVGSVYFQNDILAWYFKSYEFPSRTRNTSTKLDWLKQHLNSIRPMLASFSCHCDYPKDLSIIFKKSPETLSLRELASLILAEFHYTTPLHIEKLLKKRSASDTPRS